MSSHDCAPPCPLPACVPACLPRLASSLPKDRDEYFQMNYSTPALALSLSDPSCPPSPPMRPGQQDHAEIGDLRQTNPTLICARRHLLRRRQRRRRRTCNNFRINLPSNSTVAEAAAAAAAAVSTRPGSMKVTDWR